MLTELDQLGRVSNNLYYLFVCRLLIICKTCAAWLQQVLETALALPGVRSALNGEQATRLAKKGCLPSLHERAGIYLLLIEVIGKLTKGQHSDQAKKVVPCCYCCAINKSA